MTVREMIQEVFENLAEPTDLEINTIPGDNTTFDINLEGSQRILRYLNIALVRVANYVYPDGAILKFPSLMRKLYFTHPAPYTGTVLAAGGRTVVVPGFASNFDADFDGWRIFITGGTGVGQSRLITDSRAVAATEVCELDKAWDTIPDATSTFELYKNYIDLFPQGTLGTRTQYNIVVDPYISLETIQKIIDRNTNTVLGRALYSDVLEGAYSKGIPSEWYRRGNRILFDTLIQDERTYEIWYYAQPATLTDANQIPEIPAPFHEAVTLYATHKLRSRQGDFDGQYVDKRNFVELMATLRQPSVLSLEYDKMSIEVYE